MRSLSDAGAQPLDMILLVPSLALAARVALAALDGRIAGECSLLLMTLPSLLPSGFYALRFG